MRYDSIPLWRSTIGFDRLFDVLDEVQRTSEDFISPTTSNGRTRTTSRFRSLSRASPLRKSR